MNCFAHIFIGKEFEQLGQDIGRATYRCGGSAVSCLNYYLLDMEQSTPVLKKLAIKSSAPSPEFAGMDRFVNTQWVNCDIKDKDLSAIYRLNIFNDLLGGVNRGAHSCLYVCIHFPFYKSSAFNHLSVLYSGIRNAHIPDKISFIGYCSDLAEMISPTEREADKLPHKAQISSYIQFKEKNDVLISQHLLLFQNAFQNGMPLNLTKDSLVDVISLLLLQYVEHYDTFYPDTISYSDMVSFGISAISLDKYMFVDYLFCQTMRHVMDSLSVMDDEVSVNDVFVQVQAILHNKERVLSNFLEKYEIDESDKSKIIDAENTIREEAKDIIKRCEDIMRQNKSMPAKAAILAALSQANCDLFNQMIYDPDSPTLNDLFSEPIDYFINHDKSHFFWSDEDTPPINPIKELKTLNNQLINHESQIRELQRSLDIYQVELANQKAAEKVSSFGDDGYFHVEDKKYRLLPKTDEEPLQESYQPHDVKTESLDLRDNFREIQDQGSQGSCLAFALTSIFEYVMRSNNRRKEYDLSEAFLYYNARKLDPNNSEKIDSGSRFKPAIDSLCQYGIAVEALCRYDENSYDIEPSSEAYEDAKTRLLRKAVNVSHKVADIKSALEDGYPIAASFTLCPSFSKISRGFVPMPTSEEIEAVKAYSSGDHSKHSSHAMVIVGFDDKIQCFLVRNSWGTWWGENGYCYIPYAYIENDTLFEFACILTEIESIEVQEQSTRKIPILHLDDSDISIRYHTALVAIDNEIKQAESIKTKRNALLMKLESLKQLFSNHNNCETYIQKTCENTVEEQKELRDKIKEEQKDIDKEYDMFQSIKKKLIIKTACISISVMSFIWLYNLLITWVDKHFEGIRMFVNEKFIDNLNELFIKNKAEYISYLSNLDSIKFAWWLSAIIILLIVGFFFFKGHRTWKVWRESKNEHERQIYLYNKEIAAKQKELSEFRFRTQVVRKWLSELMSTQTTIQQLYTNITSRINNLRSWYSDISNMEEELAIHSAVPFTTVLDKTIMDKFFESSIKNNPDFEFDFSNDLDKHQNTQEYMAEYKSSICDKVRMQLLENSRLKAFHITEHIISDAFSDIAMKIVQKGSENAISMENIKRQSEVFMHINSLQRGVIMPSTYVMAPFTQQYEYKLRQKVGHNFDTYLQSSAVDRLVMLQIMCLRFDECTMFQ